MLLLKYKSCKLAEYSFEGTPLLYSLKYNNKEAMNAILHHPKIKKYINIGTNPIIYILSEHSGELKYKLIEYLFNYSFIDVNNTMSQIHPVNTALIECIKTIQTDPINHKIINILLSKINQTNANIIPNAKVDNSIYFNNTGLQDISKYALQTYREVPNDASLTNFYNLKIDSNYKINPVLE